MKEIKVLLKADREKPVQARHPWIFSGSIDLIDEDYKAGDIVRVYSARGEFLGKGYLNPHSEIAVRMLTHQDEAVDESFFSRRIGKAVELRRNLLPRATNAYRLINAEGDFLPGLIVDHYASYLVVQILTVGMEHLESLWLPALQTALPIKGVYEKNDAESRHEEGLEDKLATLCGEEPPDFIRIEEYGAQFIVDVKRGQKTGFFLDQRENRNSIRKLARGKRVLNAFAYTGGFSVCAALGEAELVTSVESSESALNTCFHNFEINGLEKSGHNFLRDDVFDFLRKTKEEFDIVILDPPAFAKSKSQVIPASRGYKDINLWAMRRLRPGGLLFSSSCSSHVSMDLFQKILFGAAKDAKRYLQILAKTSHPFDHPVSLYHPEGEYLKGILCRVCEV